MKRRDFLRYLQSVGIVLWREGAKHSVVFNPSAHRFSTIPRHREINDFLAKKICNDLGIAEM